MTQYELSVKQFRHVGGIPNVNVIPRKSGNFMPMLFGDVYFKWSIFPDTNV